MQVTALIKGVWITVLAVLAVAMGHTGEASALSDEAKQWDRSGVMQAAPADFDRYWQRSLASLAPEHSTLAYDPDAGTLSYIGVDGAPCSVAYIPPATEKVEAAILHIREVSYVPPRIGASGGCAHIIMNWLPEARGDFNADGLPDADQYCLRRAVLDACLLVEQFLNHPDVEASRVGIVGEGLGGAVALAVAALMPERVDFVVAYEPAPAYHYRSDGRPAAAEPLRSVLLDAEARFPRWSSQLRESTRYFDAVNFAANVHCPALVVLGTADGFATEPSVRAIYRSLGGQRQLVAIEGLPHQPADEPLGWEAQYRDWVLGYGAHIQPRQAGDGPVSGPANDEYVNNISVPEPPVGLSW